MSAKRHSSAKVLSIALLTLLMVLVSLLVQWSVAQLSLLRSSLPAITPESLELLQSMSITDRTGKELYRMYGEQDRVNATTDDMPAHVREAFVSIEDERFWFRPCVDLPGIARAAWVNYTTDQTQGGSTITQQVVRNVFLTPGKTYRRKVQELLLACELETQLSKERILTLYLNLVPLGGNTYGIRQAARVYFGKTPQELTVAEAAVLAALPQRPSYYSPYGTHRYAKTNADGSVEPGLIGISVATASGGTLRIPGRAELVLDAMARRGIITLAEREQAQDSLGTLTFLPRSALRYEPNHFVFFIRSQLHALMEKEGTAREWRRSGITIRTTLDPVLQAAAEQTVNEVFPNVAKWNRAKNVAMVVMDRETREVLAYVGNAQSAEEKDVDMAAALRQPGSAFKPFVYAALLQTGYGSEDKIADSPLQFGFLKPRNYEGGYLGWITIRKALAQSRNIPAIRALILAGGEERVLQTAHDMGVVSPLQTRDANRADGWESFAYGYPLAIGSAETSLLELVTGYSTIADHGSFSPAVSIREVQSSSGSVLFTPANQAPRQVVDARVADALTDILSDNSARPKKWAPAITLPPDFWAAWKTGTGNVCFLRSPYGNCWSYGINNTWTIGYTRKLAVGVWVGNADNTVMHPDADGLNSALPLWQDFVLRADSVQ